MALMAGLLDWNLEGQTVVEEWCPSVKQFKTLSVGQIPGAAGNLSLLLLDMLQQRF